VDVDTTVARLARISVTDEEAASFVSELSAILGYVEQLSNVDVTGLQPTNQVTGLTNVMRDDKVTDYGYQPADLLKNVPAVQDGHLKVKRMIE
jgi:aspartyl-tRNA(Asn)/glutamyl-tRNA(Gln) amidotransferase subunit C